MSQAKWSGRTEGQRQRGQSQDGERTGKGARTREAGEAPGDVGGSPGGCGSPSKIPDPTWLKDITKDFSEKMFGQKDKRSVTAEEKEKGSRWGNRICKGQAVRKSWETCS